MPTWTTPGPAEWTRFPPPSSARGHRDGVKYYGVPSGFEFAMLLDTIVAASSNRSPLQLETRRRLKRMKGDVHIQVFVTPT